MSDLADKLLSAYQENDASNFAVLCKTLHESNGDRLDTANRLVRIICEPDARRAELAVNTMALTGIALEQGWHAELALAAEKRFTSQVLARLATNKPQPVKASNRKFPPEVRLLRSIIRTLAQKSEPRAKAFLDNVEVHLTGSALQPYVTKWRQINR